MALDEKVLPSGDVTLARDMDNLAVVYSTQGKYAAAEALFRQALAINEQALGQEDPNVALVADQLAKTLHSLGRDADAKVYEDQAEKIRAKINRDSVPGNQKPQ